MAYLSYFGILVIGLSGITAQVLLLRELLVNFLGNELTLGIMLGNWLILEALGVYSVSRLFKKYNSSLRVFLLNQGLFIFGFPLALYFSHSFKNLLSINYGEGLGIFALFFISAVVFLPVAISHGALFSLATSVLFPKDKYSVGRVYAFETIGTLLGGIIVTYICIPFLNSFQVAFFISIANLVVTGFISYFKKINSRIIFIFGAVVLFIFSFLFMGSAFIQEYSVKKQWNNQKVLEYRNSVYGNLVLTARDNQRVLFYNGIPIIITPNPDLFFTEGFSHFPLLFHENPRDILIIGSGLGGIISEVLKYQAVNIDYLELDPSIISIFEEHQDILTQKELSDPRLTIIASDGRLFLKDTDKDYDIVLIGFSSQEDLSLNRFFTKEFFGLVKSRLKDNGIFSFWLSGSETFLSRNTKEINFSILNSLEDTFAHTLVIPGDYNIFLASPSLQLNLITSSRIKERLVKRGILTQTLSSKYIDYRLDKEARKRFYSEEEGIFGFLNEDMRPFATFIALASWSKKFTVIPEGFFESVKKLKLRDFVIPLILIMTVFLGILNNSKGNRASIGYAIFSTGFFGMLISLILILSYQVIYGNLYRNIGLLISIFMSGSAAGALLMMRIPFLKAKGSYGPGTLLIWETLIIIFSLTLAIFIKGIYNLRIDAMLSLVSLFFIAGMLVGLEFFTASAIYFNKRIPPEEAAGTLYAADLLGGWCAGLAGGVFFIPVLGIKNTCFLIALFKISSITLLALNSLKMRLRE